MDAIILLIAALASRRLVGEGLVSVVPAVWIRRLAGLGFLVLGVLFLAGGE